MGIEGSARAKWSWIFVDVGNSAFATTILTAVFPIYFPKLLPSASVEILGLTLSPLSLWAYTVSTSLFITLILTLFLGSWADVHSKRKWLMGLFCIIGSIATMGLGVTENWSTALSLFVLANLCFSASTIFNNALLPFVAKESDWHKLSLKGFAWGYFGGGLMLAFNLLMIMKPEIFGIASTGSASRVSFIFVGIWWLLWSLPSLFWIEETKPLAKIDITPSFKDHLFQLLHTLKDLPSHKLLLWFLIAYALFNDGIQTVISMSSIYGKEVAGLQEGTLIGTFLVIQFLGLPFTLLMNRLIGYWGAKKTLVLSLIFWSGILLYAYKLNTATEFWILGILVSIVLGVSQALPRSIFAALVPKGKHAEYFAFFALSGKLTSILGPLTFGVVESLTNNPRLSLLSLGILLIGGLLITLRLPIDSIKTSAID